MRSDCCAPSSTSGLLNQKHYVLAIQKTNWKPLKLLMYQQMINNKEFSNQKSFALSNLNTNHLECSLNTLKSIKMIFKTKQELFNKFCVTENVFEKLQTSHKPISFNGRKLLNFIWIKHLIKNFCLQFGWNFKFQLDWNPGKFFFRWLKIWWKFIWWRNQQRN